MAHPRRRSATARSVLAGEASAEAARKSTQEALDSQETLAPLDTSDREPQFPVHGDAMAAAFFDLDNTVMQGAALFHFGRGLYKRKFFETRDLARFAWQQAWFRLAGVEDPEHMQEARDSALSIVQGHRVSELMSIGEEIYDEYMAERIWPGTRALAQAHLDAGQKVWLVTAAPVEIAQVIARRLGLTGALGTVAESVDGVYTGKLVGEPLHGPAKAEAVRALAAAEDLDLSCCAAYSDSHNDIPMLSSSATPTPSTPTPSSASTRATSTGGCATTAPAARPRRSASRRRRVWARWRAARRRRSRCTDDGDNAGDNEGDDDDGRDEGAAARPSGRAAEAQQPGRSFALPDNTPHRTPNPADPTVLPRNPRPVLLSAHSHNTPWTDPKLELFRSTIVHPMQLDRASIGHRSDVIDDLSNSV